MAHEVKVMEGKTFRLSLVVCPPYNADFDGDEMNLHVPQSEEARTEAEFLLKVQEHIISPRYGGPIIGGIQDFISVGYMFTRNEKAPGVPNVYSRKDTYSLLYWGNVFKRNPSFSLDQITPWNPDDPPEKWMYTGKEIFSDRSSISTMHCCPATSLLAITTSTRMVLCTSHLLPESAEVFAAFPSAA